MEHFENLNGIRALEKLLIHEHLVSACVVYPSLAGRDADPWDDDGLDVH